MRAATFRSAQMKNRAPPAMTFSTSTAETTAAMVQASVPESPNVFVRYSTITRHRGYEAPLAHGFRGQQTTS